MTDRYLHILIIRYLNGDISEKDKVLLSEILQDKKKIEAFKKYLSINYLVNNEFSEFNYKYPLQKALAKIKKEQDAKSPLVKLKTTYLRYAAAIVILLVSLPFVLNKTSISEHQIDVDNSITIGTDKATLILEDGSNIVLEKGKTYASKHVSSNGESIIYNVSDKNASDIAYNYLEVPTGGQFFVELSDGTQVWLNSESKLKYPTAFADGKTREVELLYGEAYFEVSSSENHNGSDFRVMHNMQEVQVLGTEFNIKAYQDEERVYTTLAEGKIAINSGQEHKIIAPGQQALIEKNNTRIVVNTVNVDSETSWRLGVFSFREKPLENIMRTLSRWYDFKVVYVNEALKDVEFRGVLGKNQDIEEILLSIKNLSIIKDYKIKGKTIFLN